MVAQREPRCPTTRNITAEKMASLGWIHILSRAERVLLAKTSDSGAHDRAGLTVGYGYPGGRWPAMVVSNPGLPSSHGVFVSRQRRVRHSILGQEVSAFARREATATLPCRRGSCSARRGHRGVSGSAQYPLGGLILFETGDRSVHSQNVCLSSWLGSSSSHAPSPTYTSQRPCSLSRRHGRPVPPYPHCHQRRKAGVP